MTQEPFKLVYSVIRYAIKHRHPECRSAFTYCEDEPPSRIDFGKSKYGGPFTTEHVEDVKTFLRFIVFILIAVMTFCAMFAFRWLHNNMLMILTDASNIRYASLSKCYYKKAFIEIFVLCSFVILPLYELIFCPVCHQCLDMIKTWWKFILGILLMIAESMALLVIARVYNKERKRVSNALYGPCNVFGKSRARNSNIDQ